MDGMIYWWEDIIVTAPTLIFEYVSQINLEISWHENKNTIDDDITHGTKEDAYVL